MQAAIYGFSGTVLTADERAFFKEAKPFAYILFKRNCDTPAQLKALTDSLRELSGRENLPILIDQEGGRVARLGAPHWPVVPAAGVFATLAAQKGEEIAARAIYLQARLIAHTLQESGITVNCAPLADIPAPDCDDIIGDRAFGTTPQQVAALAAAQAEGLMDGGVLPVLKHLPGHGRATCDSHKALPIVDCDAQALRSHDYYPFKALNHLPFGMTAHIRYTAIDGDCVSTQSPAVIQTIRDEIGFGGLLMSDDLSMHALTGSFTERAEKTLAAGCDLVLHCNGLMVEMQAVSAGAHDLPADCLSFYEAVYQTTQSRVSADDFVAIEAELAPMLSGLIPQVA